MYENQEGCIRDYAERDPYRDIPTAMSPESFVRGAVSTLELSTSYSDARVSSTQSAETTDLVTPDLIQGTPQMQLTMPSKKRENYSFESSNNLNKNFLLFQLLTHRFYVFIFV